MTPAQINEVWSMLDREVLAGVVRQGPKPVFAAVSGAKHIARLAARGLAGHIVGLDSPTEVLSRLALLELRR